MFIYSHYKVLYQVTLTFYIFIGELHGLNAYYTLYGMKDVLAKHMRLSKWETERLIEGFLDETRTYQMYCKYTRVYGKKIVT